ncbi:hypothetical protein KIPB_014716, partial [Kipferlia bialata]|eukprot:g14716.t1
MDLAVPGPIEEVFYQNSCVTRSIGLDGVLVDTPDYEYTPLEDGECCALGDGMILLSGASGEYILDTETMELIRDMREAPGFSAHCSVDGVLHTFGKDHCTYTVKRGWTVADSLPECVHPVRQAEAMGRLILLFSDEWVHVLDTVSGDCATLAEWRRRETEHMCDTAIIKLGTRILKLNL